MLLKCAGVLLEPVKVIALTLRQYLRLDIYIGAVIVVFALIYVPTIPRATDNATMLATATNDDPWLTMALDATLAKPFGNPANYFDRSIKAHNDIPSRWGKLRYDAITYYGGAVFMLATPIYAVARLAGLPPFPTAPIILRSISVLGGLLSLIVLCNFAKRLDMRWAGLLGAVYLMTDFQFGVWTRMAHPDTLQVFFALLALVVGLRHADRGDLASLAALGLLCGFVQGAKAGGPWTVPMGLLAMVWGLHAAKHRLRELKPLFQRTVLLGSTALLGYFISTPYVFTNSYLWRTFREVWTIQGLGGTDDGPFGRITLLTWIDAIYAHIGPLAAVLVVVALIRIALELFRTPLNRAVTLAGVLSASQFVWYAGFGKYWVLVGYLVLAIGLMAVLAFDSCIVLLQRLLQLGLRSAPRLHFAASRIATVTVVSIAVLLGAPRVLQNLTVTMVLVPYRDSTQVAVNEWAIRAGVLGTDRILYDDMAYLDPSRFPNAISHPKPTWGTIDSKTPDYLVLSSSIYDVPYYRPLLENQKLSRGDSFDLATGAYSVRLYQDLLPYDKFGPTAIPGIDYVAEIKAVPLSYSVPAWTAPLQSPVVGWVFTSLWLSDHWARYGTALIRHLLSSENLPTQGPTFRVYRIHYQDGARQTRYSGSCDESDKSCTNFKQKLAQGEPMVIAFDSCTMDIGTIACGKNYTVRFRKDGDAWCSSLDGPRVGSPEDVRDFAECIGDPIQGTISVFSVSFAYNDKGEIYMLLPRTLVGHLKVKQ